MDPKLFRILKLARPRRMDRRIIAADFPAYFDAWTHEHMALMSFFIKRLDITG